MARCQRVKGSLGLAALTASFDIAAVGSAACGFELGDGAAGPPDASHDSIVKRPPEASRTPVPPPPNLPIRPLRPPSASWRQTMLDGARTL